MVKSMNNKDKLELKRRLTKNGCTFTRMCACYVDGDKNVISMTNETFLNLDDSEFFKYLDIARGVFKGRIGNNLLDLEFDSIEKSGQQLLADLRDSKLKDTELVELVCNRIIHSYGHVGNYLILLFHDAYDVLTKTSDGEKLDESEEVYEYILGAICPVSLTAPGLGYNEHENRITTRTRDWVVGKPDTGFIWPAFTDRQEDRDTVTFYTKDARNPRVELVTNFLGCKEKLTFAERQENLKMVIEDVLGEDSDCYNFLNEHLLSLAEYPKMENGEEKHAVVDEKLLRMILEDLVAYEESVNKIVQQYKAVCERFGYPKDIELLDEKAAKAARAEMARRELKERREVAEELLKMAGQQLEEPDEYSNSVCSSIKEFLGEKK